MAQAARAEAGADSEDENEDDEHDERAAIMRVVAAAADGAGNAAGGGGGGAPASCVRGRAIVVAAMAALLLLAVVIACVTLNGAKGNLASWLAAPPPELPPPDASLAWPNESSFAWQCGVTQRLDTCEGYTQCMDAVKAFREPEFLARITASRTGPPPLTPARAWCTKDACIDRSRCALPFKLYQYTKEDVAGLPLAPCLDPTNMSHPSLAAHVTTDPSRACAFWFGMGQALPCKRFRSAVHLLPHWRGNGLNHVFVDHSDSGVSAETRGYLGRAIVAQGHATLDRHARGVDIPLGLHPKGSRGARDLTLYATPPWARKYLLTFKGTHSHVSRVRAGLHHDASRRTLLVTLPHPLQCAAHTRLDRPFAMRPTQRLRPLHADCCARLKPFYDHYSYADLMNASFALVAPGRQPASYRLAEVLGRGLLPVFFGFEDALLPYEELVDWAALSLNVPVDVDFERVLYPLLDVIVADRPRARAMQAAAKAAYERYFSSADSLSGTCAVVETLRRRFEYELRR
jgi:hypothetical protein